MAEFPKVEQQNTGTLLRDRKLAVAGAKKEAEESKAVLQHASDLMKQNEFYEREIDGARGRIFVLLVSQMRHAEIGQIDEYLSQIESALAALTEKEKKEGE